MKKTILCLVMFSSLILMNLPAQEEKLVERTVLVLDLVNYSDQEGELEMIGGLVSDTVSIVLSEMDFSVISGDRWRGFTEKLGFDADRYLDKVPAMDFAAALGADVLVNGFFRVEENEVVIGVTAYDIFTGLIAVGSSIVGPAGVGIYDTIDETAVVIAGKIREALKPLPASVIEVQREKIRVETRVVEEIVQLGKKITVTFYSKDEGAQLLLADGTAAGVIQDGKLEYQAHPETSLLVSIQKERHYTREETYTIPAEDTEIELPRLFRKTKWDFSLFSTLNTPIGLGALYRYNIIPDFIYLYSAGGLYYHPASYRISGNPGLNYFIVSLEAAPGIGFCPFIPVRSPVRLMVGVDFLMDLYYMNNPDKKSFAFTGVLDIRIRLDVNFPQWIVYVELNGFGGLPMVTSNGVRDSTNRLNYNVGFTWKK